MSLLYLIGMPPRIGSHHAAKGALLVGDGVWGWSDQSNAPNSSHNGNFHTKCSVCIAVVQGIIVVKFGIKMTSSATCTCQTVKFQVFWCLFKIPQIRKNSKNSANQMALFSAFHITGQKNYTICDVHFSQLSNKKFVVEKNTITVEKTQFVFFFRQNGHFQGFFVYSKKNGLCMFCHRHERFSQGIPL